MTKNNENYTLATPEQYKQSFRGDWEERTWWGKLKISPAFLLGVVFYPLVVALNVLKDVAPPTYKDETDQENECPNCGEQYNRVSPSKRPGVKKVYWHSESKSCEVQYEDR